MVNAKELSDLRNKYSLWLTDEVNEKLFLFEKSIMRLGTSANLLDKTRLDPRFKSWQDEFQKMNNLFNSILELNEKDEMTQELTITRVKSLLKELLGTSNLTNQRQKYINTNK